MLLLYIAAGVLVIVALFLAFVFVVCLWERQYLSGDVEPAAEPFPYRPSPYWKVTREMAFQLGLQHGGDFATCKNTSPVKGLQSVFLTQDRLTIVSVVSASSFLGKLKKTVLRSQLANGRVLESTDNPGVDDLSGMIERSLLLNAGLRELLYHHDRRLEQAGSSALEFSPNALLQAYERFDLDRGGRYVLLGLARWVDPQQTSIRMSVRGAYAHVRSLLGMFQKLDQLQARAAIPRAGGH